jgi:hypothetical protein
VDKEITAKAIKQGLDQILQFVKVENLDQPIVTLVDSPITSTNPQGRSALLIYPTFDLAQKVFKILTMNSAARELLMNSRS